MAAESSSPKNLTNLPTDGAATTVHGASLVGHRTVDRRPLAEWQFTQREREYKGDDKHRNAHEKDRVE